MSQQSTNVPLEIPAKSSRSSFSSRQLEKICYRLGTSVKSGIPIAEAWENETQLLRRSKRKAFERVQAQLKAGGSLADAMAAERDFPSLLSEMVRVGEESGRLDQALLRVADHYRALVRMKRTFLQGVTWPMLQLSAAAVVVSFFFIVLHVLETRIAGLVAPDVFLMGFSPLENLVVFWAVLVGGGLALFLLVKGVKSGWFGSLPMRAAMMVPLLGSTIKELALSRFAWAFGAAVDTGMNAAKAMQLGLRSTQNRYYQSHEREIATSLAAGEDFFSALHRTDAFPADLLQAVRTGELTGELTEGLQRLSDEYQEQSSMNLRRIGQISGFGIFMTVGSVLAFSVLFMYAGYLSMVSDALSGHSLTLEQIRADQVELTRSALTAPAPSLSELDTSENGEPADEASGEEPAKPKNPIIATRDAMVKDFVENNEDFKQFESIYKTLGRYNEMTPDEFLDAIAPAPAPQPRPVPSPAPQGESAGEEGEREGSSSD